MFDRIGPRGVNPEEVRAFYRYLRDTNLVTATPQHLRQGAFTIAQPVVDVFERLVGNNDRVSMIARINVGANEVQPHPHTLAITQSPQGYILDWADREPKGTRDDLTESYFGQARLAIRPTEEGGQGHQELFKNVVNGRDLSHPMLQRGNPPPIVKALVYLWDVASAEKGNSEVWFHKAGQHLKLELTDGKVPDHFKHAIEKFEGLLLHFKPIKDKIK
jgi:hypothetical protein